MGLSSIKQTYSGQAKVWDRFAEGYSKTKIADEESYNKKLQVTQTYLSPDMKVLEIGCGTGGTSLIHAAHVKHILATDISQNMVEIASKKASDAKVTNVDFKRASVQELDIPAASMDAVLGLSILHLLPDKDHVIRQVHSWLKPGGVFVTSTFCAADMSMGKQLLMKSLLPIGQFFGLLPSVVAFTKKDLKESLQEGGFRIDHEWQSDKPDSAVFIVAKKGE